jgi:hypothetical protein
MATTATGGITTGTTTTVTTITVATITSGDDNDRRSVVTFSRSIPTDS